MSDSRASVAGGRLLLVVPSATSFSTFFAGVAEEWRRRGGVVAVAAGPDLRGHATSGPDIWPEGVERLALPECRGGSPVSMLRASSVLNKVIRGWRPDIVHAHFAAAVCVAAVARTFLAEPPVWIGTFHGLHGTQGSGAWIVGGVERWSASRMTQVRVVNGEDLETLRRQNAMMSVHVDEPYGLGCDLHHFDGARYSDADRERMRCEAGIPVDAFVMVFLGRQTAFKGFADTVRAFRILRRAGVDVVLLLVGVGDGAHHGGLSAVERRELERDPRVIRAGWRQDVAPWLAVADVCLLPSVREGMPVSLMESLAMGVPAITVDARGCRDVVRHGVDGLVLSSPDPKGIAAAVGRLVADRALLGSMRAAAVEGRQRFDRRRFITAQVDLYTASLRRRGAEGGCPPAKPAVASSGAHT